MALVTTCPHCSTSFRVVADQLKLRRGLVRCGACLTVFSGLDHLRRLEADSAESPSGPESASAPGIASASDGASASASANGPDGTASPTQASSSEHALDAFPTGGEAELDAGPEDYAPFRASRSDPDGRTGRVAFVDVPGLGEPAPPGIRGGDGDDDALEPLRLEELLARGERARYAAQRLSRGESGDLSEQAFPHADAYRALADLESIEGRSAFDARKRFEEREAPEEDDAIEEGVEAEEPATAGTRHDAGAVATSDTGRAAGEAATAEDDDAAEDHDPASNDDAGEVDDAAGKAGWAASRAASADTRDTFAADPALGDDESAIDYFSADERRRGFVGRHGGLKLLLAALLVGALALQAVIAQRDWLAARFPALEPMVAALTGPLGLPIRLPKSLDSLSIESFEMQASGRPGLYSASAIVRNDARHAVRWPSMLLTLTDPGNRVLVRRIIDPKDYLGPLAEQPLRPHSERPIRLALEAEGVDPAGYSVVLFYR